jgi:glucuronoarabinoxylan endo-1,4-beta-xylanase
MPVSLKVFDMLGREVATILSDILPAGDHLRQWTAAGLSSGVYVCRLQAGSFVESRAIVLLK